MERIDVGTDTRVWFVKETPEHEIMVVQFLYTFAVCTFPSGYVPPNWYEDRWCYATAHEAEVAAHEWDGAQGTDPPGNWIRHVPSHRQGPGAKP